MITLQLNLIRNLIDCIKSESLIKTYSTPDFKLKNSEFSHIQSIKYIENIDAEFNNQYFSHHVICLITRKTDESNIFSCIYLIDILKYKVVGFYYIREEVRSFYYDWCGEELYIRLYYKRFTRIRPDEYLLVSNICGVYLLLKTEIYNLLQKEGIEVDYITH